MPTFEDARRPPILPILPKIHPRTREVEAARQRVSSVVCEIMEGGTTLAEVMGILAGEMASVAKYALRDERRTRR